LPRPATSPGRSVAGRRHLPSPQARSAIQKPWSPIAPADSVLQPAASPTQPGRGDLEEGEGDPAPGESAPKRAKLAPGRLEVTSGQGDSVTGDAKSPSELGGSSPQQARSTPVRRVLRSGPARSATDWDRPTTDRCQLACGPSGLDSGRGELAMNQVKPALPLGESSGEPGESVTNSPQSSPR